MKIQKRNNKSVVLAATIGVLVLLGGYTAFAAYSHNWPFKNPPTSQEQPNDTANSDSDYNPPTNTNNPDKTPPQYDTPSDTNEPEKSTISGVINYKSVSDGTLSIRTTIDQKLDTGTCVLKLTRNSPNKSVTKSADIIANPSSSTCKGFDVPTSELSTGSWKIVITVTSGEKKGEITGNVSI
jgi:hypothetical protein